MIRIRPLYLIFLLFNSYYAQAAWYKETQHIMGTVAQVELWAVTETQADTAIKKVMGEFKRIDRLMSPYNPSSELSTINTNASYDDVYISKELFLLLEKSLFYSGLSEGAFDISFSSVGRFYSYPNKQQPSEQQLRRYTGQINYRNIQLNKDGYSIRFLSNDMAIDLGGIAKGYAVDQAINLLRDQGVTEALVSAGGDSRIMGTRQGTPWMIGIQHPRNENQQIIRLPLADTAISTSGDYERFFMKGSERIHHIIDPSSGGSAHAVQSVTVLAPKAVDSDALSTTVFVMGVQKGLGLINKLAGIDAVIIDDKGLVHYSDGLLMPVIPNPASSSTH